MSAIGRMTDAQTMALEMFKDSVPCLFSLYGECDKTAKWLVEMTHLGEDCGELEPNPAPFCNLHKEQFLKAFNPFWRMFCNVEPTICDHCGVEIGVGEVAPI